MTPHCGDKQIVIPLLYVPLPLGPNSIKTHMEYSLKYFSSGVSNLIRYFGAVITQHFPRTAGTIERLLPRILSGYSPTYLIGWGSG